MTPHKPYAHRAVLVEYLCLLWEAVLLGNILKTVFFDQLTSVHEEKTAITFYIW